MYYVRTFRESWLMVLMLEKKTDMTILSLKNCQSEFNLTKIWVKAKFIS